jgi:threonine aldolase
MDLVDLRSDTVTRPTPAMRKAMAEAEVGDDVFGEDPTVKRLEERVAELLGTEAALFVPSGTMANQIALKSHLRPGDEVIIGRDAHCWRHEAGALAALAGAQTLQLAGYTFTAAEVKAAYKSDADAHSSPTRVVAVENTHNMGGGAVWDPTVLGEVVDAAHALHLAAHLDGARLWNAAVASKRTEAELAAGFDSISVCLSKGLGAPAGSLVAGARDVIRRCHRLRKMHGGGMRQIGILAAAGLHALEHHRARLAEDHANARFLAECLAGAPNLVLDPTTVRTNIVMVQLERGTGDALIALAREDGVLINPAGPQRVRCVTHLDVTRPQIERAASVLRELAAAMGTG